MSGLTRVSASGVAGTIDDGGAQWLAAEIVRRFEGLRLAPYFCPAGRLTVGYGHVILPGEDDLRGGIDLDAAEALLHRDLAWSMRAARDVGRVLTAGQTAALASLIYNIGLPAWESSTLRRYVVDGDWLRAAAEFGRWVKVDGRVVAGLVSRRETERRFFEGGIWIG